jgi:sugar phosphate isomerase/epimerase
MKLAASNLAWRAVDDEIAAQLLAARGVQGIEIAPMKIWPDAPTLGLANAKEYRARWHDRGFELVALQGILFQKPDLQLFGDRTATKPLQAHLSAMARLASRLGARVIVLGAPANRRRGTLSFAAAVDRAADVLRVPAEAARAEGCMLCIEPNPIEYGCDFVNTASEGALLVKAVDDAGFGLHLDAGALTASGEVSAAALRNLSVPASHFHASEIGLGPLGAGTVDHQTLGATLREIGYAGWCSIEMREATDVPAAIARACDIARSAYLIE